MVMLLAVVTCPGQVVVGKKIQFCAVQEHRILVKTLVLSHLLSHFHLPLGLSHNRLDLSFSITGLF